MGEHPLFVESTAPTAPVRLRTQPALMQFTLGTERDHDSGADAGHLHPGCTSWPTPEATPANGEFSNVETHSDCA